MSATATTPTTPTSPKVAQNLALGVLLGGIGLAILGAGMALLATLPAAPAIADIVWRMVVCGRASASSRRRT